MLPAKPGPGGYTVSFVQIPFFRVAETMMAMLFLLLALSSAPGDPISSALESYGSVTSYRVTLRSRHDDTSEIIRYFFRKPGYIRMEFIDPHKGVVIVYDPESRKVRLRPFGIVRPLVLTLSPDNSLVKSERGHRVDESDLGALLRRINDLQQHGRTLVVGEEKVGGRDALLVSVEGVGGYSLDGIHRYLVWLDRKSHLPLKTSAHDESGNLVEEVLMDDLEVNVPLEESLFRL